MMECSDSLSSAVWHVPETLKRWTSWPKPQFASTGKRKGATWKEGLKVRSTEACSLGFRLIGLVGLQVTQRSASCPSPSSRKNSTGRLERFTTFTLRDTGWLPTVTPKSTVCMDMEAISNCNWHPEPLTLTVVTVVSFTTNSICSRYSAKSRGVNTIGTSNEPPASIIEDISCTSSQGVRCHVVASQQSTVSRFVTTRSRRSKGVLLGVAA
mmetsp:Transcript_15976/g.36043  ORF Transcript_15976/g.36043 Transcript_15976/m.36043 type:complete len:211 (-) Transcript_15976:55-687(-)